VKDGNRQQLAYVYYEEEPGLQSAAKLLTKDETRRIVVPDARRVGVNIKKLPLISHKAAANRTDALTVLAAWGANT
jgi:hypothetical protein